MVVQRSQEGPAYYIAAPMPFSWKLNLTQSNCDNPDDNGKAIEWFPAAGVPALLASGTPFPPPSKPVPQSGVISGTASGNLGPGTPDQTWTWTLNPSPIG
jgi:hypothetical protein